MTYIKKPRPYEGNIVPFNKSIFYEPFSNYFDEVFDDFFTTYFPTKTQQKGLFKTIGNYPKCDIRQYETLYEIEMEIPGLTEKEIEITYQQKQATLTIKGQKRIEQCDQKKQKCQYIRRELKKSKFYRSFYVPKNEIEYQKISAEFKDGNLLIFIPKVKLQQKEQENKITKIAINDKTNKK